MKFLNEKLVNIISILIPIVVALLLGIPYKFDLGAWTKQVPAVNAVINTLTALSLIGGYIAIKNKKIDLHRTFMLLSVLLGLFFLVGYVIYHLSNKSTHFGGTGLIAYIYFILLFSHIILAAVVVYFVLKALFYAVIQDFEKHKKVVKYALPIWLYVSITGVIVFLMIEPYYTY
jgi:putative membrane protein